MKKLILSLLMATAITACGQKADFPKTSKPVIKIGAILPLSGSQTALGESSKAGMMKALADKNKEDLHYDYQLVFEDNQAKLASMPAIASKLILQDEVDAIGTTPSAMAKTIVPITDQKGKILYSISTEKKDYERFGKYAFVQGYSSIDMVNKVIEILKKQNADNMALFAQNIGIQAFLIQDFEKRLKEENIKYVINVSNPGETDFRLTIAQDKTNGFNKFVIMMFPPEQDIVLKQLLEAGIEKKDITGFSLDMGKATDMKKGIPTITNNYGTEDFVNEIQKEYNIESTLSSSEFYDFVNLMIEAYENLYKENQAKPMAEEVTAYIQAKKTFPCMSGECSVRPNGFIINQPTVRVYQDGKWVAED